MLALVEVHAFVRAKRDLNLYDYEVGKLLDTGLYNGLSEEEVMALKKSAANKVRHLKKKDPEETKKMAAGEGLTGDKLRLSQMINTFFNEFNSDPSIECLKR